MKIVCPKCSEIKRYGRIERVHRMLLYDNNLAVLPKIYKNGVAYHDVPTATVKLN